MLARPSCLLLAALALAAPVRAEPVRTEPLGTGEPTSGGPLALPKLRAMLFDRLPGMPLKVPSSPRYLAVEDASARGTRVLVGWVLPGLTASDLPDLRALTDALAAALRTRSQKGAVPLDARVSLDVDGEAPLVVVELSSSRLVAARALEEALLQTAASLGGPAPRGEGSTAEIRPAAPVPEVSGRVAAVARAQLGPLARAVVEVHRPDVPSPVRETKPARHIVERGDTLSEIALSHGLDLGRLAELNRLDVARPIQPGVELKLTDKGPPRPKLYVVKQGDSLAKVARHFGVSEKALVEANRLDSRRLSKGQKLVVPR
jgi:LysM repeat protein